MPHLTRSQRDQLQALRRAQRPQREIARILGCAQSTISREIHRNGAGTVLRYTARTAHLRAAKRRARACAQRPRWTDNLTLVERVCAELTYGRSPDQVAGRLRTEGWAQGVSRTSIYAFVARDAAHGGDLWTFLRYRGAKYKWRGYGGTRPTIPNRRDIAERPHEVDAKARVGDWESDLVVSPQRGAGGAATFAERRTLTFRAVRIAVRTAEAMVAATATALGGFPPELRRTMTHDNGPEIVRHEDITTQLGTVVYCARPYHSWERGLNEWYNRELRRFFPKGTDFAAVSQEELDAAVAWLNHCPRRTLGYRTPAEALSEEKYAFHG